MYSFLTWAGLAIFSLALTYDFYTNWLSPRLLSRDWFPGEPNLPPVAGQQDTLVHDEYDRVLLATYIPGILILFIGVLDASPVSPTCLPYQTFIDTYLVRALALTTGLMWYSEGQQIEVSYHAEIRYALGVLAVVLPLYSTACGQGFL